MDIHALAKQMGTSIGMIERHYSHLEPRMKKEMFTGKRYDLPAEEFKKRYKSEWFNRCTQLFSMHVDVAAVR
ncbi:hypothetical protein [Roseovarius sp.]|jgi:hypothetical protein